MSLHLTLYILGLGLNNEVVIPIVTFCFQTKKINPKPLIIDSETLLPTGLESYKLWDV